MRRTAFIFTLLLIGSIAQAQLLPKLGGQRAGISALTFLKIDPSPRSAALAGAQLAFEGDAYAAYINPAALSSKQNLNLSASNTFWAAGINHSWLALSKPFKFGTLAFSVLSLNTGAMERRTEFQPDGTGEYFYASNNAIGLSYSKRLTEEFSFGATVKYVNEILAEFVAHTAVVDLGFLYRTDWKDLNFAVVMQSFGTNSKLSGSYAGTGFNDKDVTLESYPAPTLFKIGASMMPYSDGEKSLRVAVQLNHPNDNAENIRLAAEFNYRDILYLRAGYKINVADQTLPVAGLGLRSHIGRHMLHLDYGVEPTRYLGWMHRVGVRLNFMPSVNQETEMPAEAMEVTQ